MVGPPHRAFAVVLIGVVVSFSGVGQPLQPSGAVARSLGACVLSVAAERVLVLATVRPRRQAKDRRETHHQRRRGGDAPRCWALHANRGGARPLAGGLPQPGRMLRDRAGVRGELGRRVQVVRARRLASVPCGADEACSLPLRRGERQRGDLARPWWHARRGAGNVAVGGGGGARRRRGDGSVRSPVHRGYRGGGGAAGPCQGGALVGPRGTCGARGLTVHAGAPVPDGGARAHRRARRGTRRALAAGGGDARPPHGSVGART